MGGKKKGKKGQKAGEGDGTGSSRTVTVESRESTSENRPQASAPENEGKKRSGGRGRRPTNLGPGTSAPQPGALMPTDQPPQPVASPQSPWNVPRTLQSATPGPGQQCTSGRGLDPDQRGRGRSGRHPPPPPERTYAVAGAGQGDIQSAQQAVTKIRIPSGPGGDTITIQEKISVAGMSGRKIQVYTNHFEMRLGRIKKVVHYDVVFEPDKPKRLLGDAMAAFRNKYFGNCNPAFDGHRNLFSAKELPFEQEMSGEVTIVEDTKPKDFVVTVKKVNVVDMDEITRFFNQVKGNKIIEAPMLVLQVLDVVLRHSLSMRNVCVGSSFYPESSHGRIIDLGNGMELYKGNFQSVTLGWKPFLNIDVANKAFPKSDNVITIIKDLFGQNVNLHEPLGELQVETLEKFLKTLRVQYLIPKFPSTKAAYRVNMVDKPASELSFKMDDGGEPITVARYYKEVKKVALQYPKMPCLWVGSANNRVKIKLPCEFCTVMPGQPVNRKLSADQTRQMIRHCATSTDERKASIQRSLEQARYNSDPVVKEFDLNISNEFQKIDARILNPPRLAYGNNREISVRKGVWLAESFYNPSRSITWTVVNYDRRTQLPKLDQLAQMVLTKGRILGMNFTEPLRPFSTKRLTMRRELEEMKEFFGSLKGKVQLIFVVIPDQDNVYSYVKQAAEIAVGCLTQCVKSRTVFSKLNDATIVNILLKVNAKLNGTNHITKDKLPMMEVPTIIMGADVTHPSPDSQEIPSVVAVTASCDAKAFRYHFRCRLQNPGKEVIEDLESITRELLLFFYKSNNSVKPQRIVFYRDGVSNGQFQEVLQAELQAIRRACGRLQQTYKPSITFLVVQKRHHARLFPVNPRDSEDRNNNVPAGTCVDSIITHPTRQNFFLVSHASIQGVAKPTKYVTLWDDNDFSNDQLQTLTYYLCHMFARCTRSVSYPAPTYYAHLAAARAKVYIETKKINLGNLAREQTHIEILQCISKELPMFFV